MKKILILLLIFSFTIPLWAFPENISAKEDDGYYGYISRSVVSNALVKHTEIPEWKKTALMDKLSNDGYFWMATKKEKLNYIHRNLNANQYLLIVADAENVHSGVVNESGAAEINNQKSKQGQEELLAEATNNYKEWANFYYAIAKNSSNRAEWGNQNCFYQKNLWAGPNLDRLYSYYWPDLKTNRSQKEFTSEEIKRLNKIWMAGQFGDIVKALPRIKNAGEIGFTGDTPWDDVLIFVPVERLFSFALKWGFKSVKAVGSKLAERGIAVGATRVVGRSIVRIREVPLKLSTTLTVRIKFNWAKMFGRSGISEFDWLLAQDIVADRIKAHYQWLHSKGLYVARDRLAGNAQKLADGTEVVTAKEMKKRTGGAIAYCDIVRCKVVVSEMELPRYGTSKKNFVQTMDHEIGHAGSAVDQDYLHRFAVTRGGVRYVPLNEGINELISRIRTNTLGIGAYQEEVEIAQELLKVIQHERGATEGFTLLNKAFYEDGLYSIDGATRIAGLHNKLSGFLTSGDYAGATKYLRSLY